VTCYPAARLRSRPAIILFVIVAIGLAVRLYPAWNSVFAPEGVNFLETDAWYHVRLIENQVRNYPWRVTMDPYAAAGGQFVPIAPLFDTIASTVATLLHGRAADTSSVERVAAFLPPFLGTASLVVVFALVRRVFDERAAVLASALLAILPGHFMDRTMLGFVDHHALEALLALSVLLAVASALERKTVTSAVAVGVVLGLYLLTWASGAFFVAVLGAWLVALTLLARTPAPLVTAARTIVVGAIVALAMVAAFQDPRMHRYGSQIVGLLGLAAIGGTIAVVARRARESVPSMLVLATLAPLTVAGIVVVQWRNPGVFAQVITDVLRLAPDPTRMGVLEARPLFLYPGEWSWWQPWQFFRTGFYVGVAGLVALAIRVWRDRSSADVLLWLFGASTLAATIGQNRFGYYLVPAFALVGGWLASAVLAWSEMPADGRRRAVPFRRELGPLLVAGAFFAPNLAPNVLLRPRAATLSAYWRSTMEWLREETPAPFAQSAPVGDDYYLARYGRDGVPLPDYTVMNWWDQGYWLMQRGHRVPVANPTQERAPNAARFYAETDERRARLLLDRERTRYVLSDWELPFRITEENRVMGRFQNILEWAGARHQDYYLVCFRRERGAWVPVWVFREPYYRSMAYRLTVLGGAAATPAHSTTVIGLVDRTDQNGVPFKEIVSQQTYRSFDEARAAAAATANDTLIVGLDPWRSAFPVEALATLVQLHAARTPEQAPTEAPWVRIFGVR
jgi:dolichyl-phosphooligosaccharide-protein glycotransferase